MTPTTTSVRLRLALRVSVPLFLLNSVPFSSPFLCLSPSPPLIYHYSLSFSVILFLNHICLSPSPMIP